MKAMLDSYGADPLLIKPDTMTLAQIARELLPAFIAGGYWSGADPDYPVRLSFQHAEAFLAEVKRRAES